MAWLRNIEGSILVVKFLLSVWAHSTVPASTSLWIAMGGGLERILREVGVLPQYAPH